jgi:hypothetical protein
VEVGGRAELKFGTRKHHTKEGAAAVSTLWGRHDHCPLVCDDMQYFGEHSIAKFNDDIFLVSFHLDPPCL